MPDEELIRLAEEGRLSSSETLSQQVDRMLRDPKSDAFVKKFAGQWLCLREVGANPPVEKIFPRYDDHLEVSMRRESEEFFKHISFR